MPATSPTSSPGLRVLAVIAAIGGGGFVGLGLGILSGIGISILSDPDPEGKAVFLAIGITPLVALIGAVLAGAYAIRRPHLVLITVFSLGILVLGLLLAYSELRNTNRPRNYVVKLTGAEGAEFVGVILADKREHKLKGNLPAEFAYSARKVELAFALSHPADGDKIVVEVLVNGTYPHLHRKSVSKSGIHEQFTSSGYSEWAGVTHHEGGAMPAEHAELLIKSHQMPPRQASGWAIGSDR